MQIYEGTANDTTILRGGSVFVSRNKAGVTSRVLSNTVVDGGHLSVGSGCEVDGVKVNLGGTFVFSEGGVKAVNIIENGGYVSVTYGKDTTVSFLSNTFHDAELSFRTQTAATVHSGTTAVNTTVNSGGTLWIYAGGVADGIMINSRGAAKLDGGTAANVVISSMGRMLASGYRRGNDSDSLLEAVLDNVVVNSGGSLSISDAKEVNGLMVLSGGLLSIENTKETSFSGTVLCGPAATIALERGATATDTVLNEMGRLSVNYGAVAVFTTVNANGNLNVSSGGTATDIVASGGAYLGFEVAPDTFIAGTSKGSSFEIRDGGVSDYTVNCGYLNVSFGGSANNTTVNENGEFYVSDGGVADGITVNENGTMVVSGGGKLTGQMAFENGASVSMLEGAILDFDLSRTEADAEALVNGLSVIQGKTLYTLTVADDWEPGYYTYTLAEGADGFNGTISVVNRAGETLGTFTVGETITAGYNDYSLFLANSTLSVTVMAPDLTPATPVGTPDKVSWDATGANMYILEYSTDNFEHLIQLSTTAAAMDILELPAGTYQWRVKADANSEWMVGDEIVSEADPEIPKVVQAVEDGNDDLFFATPFGTWGDFSCALHTGSINDWNGTREIVLAKGRGRIQNLFFGSADPNVLCLTDADNGDAIFVDDIYTDSPEDMAKETSRLYKIQEIRAGAGDDIVDMTSQRFEYTGNGLTIRGGDGNDVLWANKGENLLFGDAGNDRIVGASSSDVIAGGIGDDTMHGGGGDDVFTFCDNWGADTVDQLETGTVTLWFASGSETNWNAESLTYTDGDNSVKVSGVTLEKITFIFGDDGSAQFAALSGMGAFDAFSSRKIFEESSAGILA
jgi:autotransporter passenger strand-loop-strand repeat protein